MNDLIPYIAMAFGGLSILYGLFRKYTNALQKIAEYEAQMKVKNDLEQIAEKARISDEKVIDFNKAVDVFNTDNKPK